ncbi:hypothetical protein LB503_008087 [Fusarium chuoi]|nr:hypothetical protein LB503_008087 [Fusarium chuoi]
MDRRGRRRWLQLCKSTCSQSRDVTNSDKGYVLFPGTFKDIIELLLPELRSRGLFWDDYAVPGGSYRENFYGLPGQKYPLDEHAASKYRWAAGVPASEHKIPQ